MKTGEEKIELPFGRTVPRTESSMISAMIATANRAEVSNRSAMFVVISYARAAMVVCSAYNFS